MRFLGIGEYCDLGSLYLQLIKEGHEVKVFVQSEDHQDIYEGILCFTTNWQLELDWIRQAGSDGIILFESATMGEIQDRLRAEGLQVIGGSAFGDKLESDRDFAQNIMHELGMPIAQTFEFSQFDAAIDFIEQYPKRYVYKSNDPNCDRTLNYVSKAHDSADLKFLLQHYKQHKSIKGATSAHFILMDFVEGVEVGVGAFFNGDEFLQPACLDWEHKHFFAGDLGELTGEMGTVVTYRNSDHIFENSLLKIAPMLKQSGYCGYINLNMIANAQGLWPLEFTSRFGYPGNAICAGLQKDSWPALFLRLIQKSSLSLATSSGFALGVVINVPPFPYAYGYKELSKGLPVLLEPALTNEESSRLHFNEVAKKDGLLVTSGMTGNVATAVGVGGTIKEAQAQAYALSAKLIVPNVRYRTDIGTNLALTDLDKLRDWGYI